MRSHRGSLTVFEVSNERLKEIYVGARPDGAAETALDAVRSRARLAHWQPEEARDMMVVAERLSPETARDFILLYVGTALPLGWRFIRD